jgi:hypothetical protein
MGVSFNVTHKSGNASFSASGGFGFGGWFAGGGASYSTDGYEFGINAGGGKNHFGVGINASHNGYGAGYYLTQYGDAIGPDGLSNKQLVGGANVFLGDVSLRMENDFLAFRGEDRWRSNAVEISINEFSVGTYLYNNYADEDGVDKSKEYLHYNRKKTKSFGKWNNGQTYMSPLYFGYRNGGFDSRVGFSHPSIQHFTQNKGAHEKGFLRIMPFGHANYFMDYEHFNKGLYLYSGPYNPYSTWGR